MFLNQASILFRASPCSDIIIGIFSQGNGRIGDLRAAAQILKGKKINPGVRHLVTPASQAIFLQALTDGLIRIFIEALALVCNPGCSACFGGQGMLWEGEICIGTHNRNFKARMGHKDSKVFLASPETVAVSAIAGLIKLGPMQVKAFFSKAIRTPNIAGK